MRIACLNRRDHPLATALSLLLVAAVVPGAYAWQRPLSPTELKERSPLVVIVEVLGVARIGKDPGTLGRYRAWVQVVQAEKGDAEPTSTLQVAWTAADPNRLGSWEVKLYPGDKVQLYLKPAGEPGVWQVVHRSGAVTLRRAPREQRTLPSLPGEVALRPSPPLHDGDAKAKSDLPDKTTLKGADAQGPTGLRAAEKTGPEPPKPLDSHPPVPDNSTKPKEKGS